MGDSIRALSKLAYIQFELQEHWASFATYVTLEFTAFIDRENQYNIMGRSECLVENIRIFLLGCPQFLFSSSLSEFPVLRSVTEAFSHLFEPSSHCRD